MIILGLHGGFNIHQHDAAATLLIDGKLVCSVEEERLVRQKDSHGLLPIYSISACLKEANITMKDVDLITLPGETYEDLKERTSSWIKHHWGHSPKIETVHHQTAHIASAFYHSGFDDAMCVSYDAFGDRLSGALALADYKNGINILETRPAENSLGVFYATMTNFLGFRAGDEYKIMGLAPYGKPNIDLSFFCKPTNTGYSTDLSYFTDRKSHSHLERYYSEKLIKKLGNPRFKGQEINAHHKNLAASIQSTLEHCTISLVEYLYKITKKNNLCIAGGVGLNCSANRLISKIPYIKNLFVQPASSDRGLSLGCALFSAVKHGEKIGKINHVFYGPTHSPDSIENQIKLTGIKYRKIQDPSQEAAKKISEGKIIAWHQGRSEFGPRALGHRSILADPGISNMKDQINQKVKFREEFRPFAPSVLEEEYQNLFNIKNKSPYMTIACDVKEPWSKKLPATTHINNTARIQTVSSETDTLYHSLIKEFYKITGRPAVLNTSFNIRGQPIVETPLEAISTFSSNGIDALFIEDFLIEK